MDLRRRHRMTTAFAIVFALVAVAKIVSAYQRGSHVQASVRPLN